MVHHDSHAKKIAHLERSSRELEKQIKLAEAELNRTASASQRKRQKMQDSRNTIPPPERISIARQERLLRSVVQHQDKGTPTNMRRELRENFMLLGVLLIAICASFIWMLRLLETTY